MLKEHTKICNIAWLVHSERGVGTSAHDWNTDNVAEQGGASMLCEWRDIGVSRRVSHVNFGKALKSSNQIDHPDSQYATSSV